ELRPSELRRRRCRRRHRRRESCARRWWAVRALRATLGPTSRASCAARSERLAEKGDRRLQRFHALILAHPRERRQAVVKFENVISAGGSLALMTIEFDPFSPTFFEDPYELYA